MVAKKKKTIGKKPAQKAIKKGAKTINKVSSKKVVKKPVKKVVKKSTAKQSSQKGKIIKPNKVNSAKKPVKKATVVQRVVAKSVKSTNVAEKKPVKKSVQTVSVKKSAPEKTMGAHFFSPVFLQQRLL